MAFLVRRSLALGIRLASEPRTVALRRLSSSGLSPAEAAAELPWSLSGAICLERLPLVTPDLTDIERRFSQMLGQIEFEQSIKCDHELRHEKDLEVIALKRSGQEVKEEAVITAMDDEDAWQKELECFKPTPRITNEEDNVRSLNRKLDRSLFLMVEKRIGDTEHFKWSLPSVIRAEGETMRETAERALRSFCGCQIQTQVLGNAPWAMYKVKYPRKIQGQLGRKGEKVFLYKAWHVSGQVEVQAPMCRDFQWLVQDELHTALRQDESSGALGRMLCRDSSSVWSGHDVNDASIAVS